MEDICGNLTVRVNETLSVPWADLALGGIHQFPHTPRSYLRSDEQALLPWIYTVIVLIVHIPTVVIRVVKWETVQLWCLACTFLTVVVYAQAYISTNFAPAQILVWTPLILLIDAGSMAQIFFLISHENYLLLRIRCLWIRIKHKLRGTSPKEEIEMASTREEERRQAEQATRSQSHQEETRTASNALGVPLFRDLSFYIAVLALFLFLIVFVLQVLGLKKAMDGNKADMPQVRWCSPIFQPFGLVVRDGNCNMYPIGQSSSKGIGCINIPGYEQKQWLQGTVAGASISIVLEFVDLLILIFVGSSTRLRGVKMRRPWCTMFSGLTVLGVTLILGVTYASELPKGISQKIWVVVNMDRPTIYAGSLISPGLRGSLIGWNDGLFASWGNTYYGY
ncbi:hypothetical protein FGG08_005688 [Glutinoglossum americanum]|uniref:Uncharacterized protein n=1 Tax=Glutinoglossum americanum TaxID=1670608 RepID=A0A9P8I2H2_9PEZI|nr:hypothetical protein FGG08_005688 [Glutinoglossum americanum]